MGKKSYLYVWYYIFGHIATQLVSNWYDYFWHDAIWEKGGYTPRVSLKPASMHSINWDEKKTYYLIKKYKGLPILHMKYGIHKLHMVGTWICHKYNDLLI